MDGMGLPQPRRISSGSFLQLSSNLRRTLLPLLPAEVVIKFRLEDLTEYDAMATCESLEDHFVITVDWSATRNHSMDLLLHEAGHIKQKLDYPNEVEHHGVGFRRCWGEVYCLFYDTY